MIIYIYIYTYVYIYIYIYNIHVYGTSSWGKSKPHISLQITGNHQPVGPSPAGWGASPTAEGPAKGAAASCHDLMGLNQHKPWCNEDMMGDMSLQLGHHNDNFPDNYKMALSSWLTHWSMRMLNITWGIDMIIPNNPCRLWTATDLRPQLIIIIPC